MHSFCVQEFVCGEYDQTSLYQCTPSVPPKRNNLSPQVIMVWFVRAGGIWPCGGPPSIVF